MWPCNLAAVNVFIAMLTQWRTAGMDGVPVGLDYGVLPEIWQRCGVPEPERTDTFQGLRILEDAALHIMSKRREEQSRRARQR